jgi:hypothetical protein
MRSKVQPTIWTEFNPKHVHPYKQHLNYMDEEMHDEHVHNRKNNMRYMKMKPNDIEIHINRDCDVKVHDDLDKEDGIWGNRDNKPDVHGGGDDDLLRSSGEREERGRRQQ